MCEHSHAPDGDWQGDGWGVAWQEEGGWQVKKSLAPIWQERDTFSTIPPAKLLVVHARSAGFPQHKGNIEFNQPYAGDGICFVFNGMLRGVSVPLRLDGTIGAQKIYSFIKNEIVHEKGDEALRALDTTIKAHTRRIVGMNVGLVQGDRFFALCEYTDNEEYFSVRYYQDPHITLLCSAPLPAYAWKKMEKGEICVF
jgi:predicted glutamine amidotransferase